MRYIQRSFSGGEISPALQARSDQAKYRAGAATLRNFLPVKTGEAVLRNGTKRAAMQSWTSGDFRLFPYVDRDGTSHVVVAHATGFRAYKLDGTLSAGTSSFTIGGETPTVEGMRMCYSGDHLVFTSSGHTPGGPYLYYGDGAYPALFKWKDGEGDSLTAVNLTEQYVSTRRIVAPSAGFVLGASAGGLTLTYAVTSLDVNNKESLVSATTSRAASLEPDPANPAAFTWTAVTHARSYNIYRYVAGVPGYVGSAATAAWADFGSVPDFAHGPPEALLTVPNAPTGCSVVGTAGASAVYYSVVARRRDGTQSAPVTLNATALVAASAVNPVTVSATLPADAVYLDVFRGTNVSPLQQGLVATYDASFSEDDEGWTPDMTKKCIAPNAAFRPSLAAFVQQRLAFAFKERPGTIIMTNLGEPDALIKYPVPNDDDAIEFKMEGGGAIRALTSLQGIAAFTDTGEWLINADGSGLTPSNVVVTRQGYSGTLALPPAHAAQTVLAYEERNAVLRAVTFDQRSDAYRGVDLSTYAAHLSDGYEIVSYAYSRVPHSVLYAVRSDGVILCLTYVPDHEIVAWSTMTLPTNALEVIVLPDGPSDQVFFKVEPGPVGGANNVLVMNTADVSDRTEFAYMDMYIDTPDTGRTPNTVISGLATLEDLEVVVWDKIDGVPLGLFTVNSGQVTIDPGMRMDALYQDNVDGLRVGVPIDGELTTLDVDIPEAETMASLKKRMTEVCIQVRNTGGMTLNGTDVPLRTTEAWSEATELATGRIRQPVNASWDDDATITVTSAPGLPCKIQAITFDFEVGV